MGLGVLDDRVMSHVPGTSQYYDDPSRPQIASQDTKGLKCDTTGPLPIILVPQPSDDPNDPLNWPLWKRDLILLILSIVSIFATSLGSILAANTITLSLHYEVAFTSIALLTGYYLLGVGIAGILFVASARIWGKRHLFLLGSVMLVASAAWGGASGGSYRSLLWARIIQGVATAPFEALVNASVGDLFFVHERGKRMALSNLAVFGAAFFTPILVGKITHTIGWSWSFYFVAIFCAACLPVVILFVPETAYRRSACFDIDLTSTDDICNTSGALRRNESGVINIHTALSTDQTCEEFEKQSGELESRLVSSEGLGGSIPKKSYRQTLMPFSGRKTDESFWKLLVRPFPLFVHPAILWGCLTQGTMVGWTVFVGIILGAVFMGSPLFWDEVKTGYAYAGAFVGAILGFLLAGGLSDWSAKYLTRKNGGVYEPEFRIVLIIPQFIFGVCGLYGFGIVSSNLVDYSWFWPVFFFGFIVMGMVVGAVGSSLYIVDAHRDIAIEAFTCLMMFKNFLSYGLTTAGYNWVVEAGTRHTFLAISSVQVAICLLSIPMYIFGKRNRSFFHRYNILKKVHLL